MNKLSMTINIIKGALLLGLSIAFLFHFGLILAYGSFKVQEPNPIILGLEIALLSGIAIFSLITIVLDFKKARCLKN